MRYATLVLAAFLAVFASIASNAAYAQKAESPVQMGPFSSIDIKPVDGIVVDYLAKDDRASSGDPARTYVMGRVTDFGGRSIRGAEITLFSLDSDDVKRVVTNTFGYYRFRNLGEGESYLISAQHRRYLFVMGSTSFTVEAEPIQIDFQAEAIP